MCPGFPGMSLGSRKWRTYRPSKKLQPRELEGVLLRHGQLRDHEEAEVHDEGENVELQKPLQKVEVGEDAGSELASDDLERLLPQAGGVEELGDAVLGSPVSLELGGGPVSAQPATIPRAFHGATHCALRVYKVYLL